MSPLLLHKEFSRTSRGRIVQILRRGPETVEHMASILDVTPNAVRSQLAAMQRDGLVQRSGQRPGATRPFHLFELTPQLDRLLSGAYVPLLVHLVRLLAAREPKERVEATMRDAGRALAAELPAKRLRSAPLHARIAAATRVMNEELGAVTEVSRTNGHWRITGRSCPLAALTGKHPAVCLAIESLLSELLPDAVVHECCDRTGTPRCCFEVAPADTRR